LQKQNNAVSTLRKRGMADIGSYQSFAHRGKLPPKRFDGCVAAPTELLSTTTTAAAIAS
jgi:hypothetical protein